MEMRWMILALAALMGCAGRTDKNGVSSMSDAGEMSGADAADAGDAGMNSGCEAVARVTLNDERGVATAEVGFDAACRRTYRLSSTAPRRGDRPSPRVVPERDGPVVRSGNALLDGLFAMALEEAGQLSVEAISDGAFNGGNPLSCAVGGCFETGAEWHYVWTRDIAYATDLAMAWVDPRRAANSLAFKLSERRGGGDLQIMQDTGTGGSYPVSSDRVVWARGARAVLSQLDDGDFRAQALEALGNTLAHDRVVVFDERTGLYRGEQSFLDWREQSYPAWVAGDPVHIAMSRSLSTNLAHLAAMRLYVELGGPEAAQWAGRADALTAAINGRFWMPDAGLYSSFLVTELDDAPTAQFDLLGNALAILLGVATDDQAARVLENYPHLGVGAPVFFPLQQFTRIYHNRAEWPFVSAYWLRAAAQVGHAAVAERMMQTLVRGAALNLSNMENWEIATGLPHVEDGDYSGPVVNSERQLWSVAGYLSFVQHTLFGLQPDLDGLRIEPRVPASFRAQYFADAPQIELRGARYRGRAIDVVLRFPTAVGEGFYTVETVRADGEEVRGVLSPDRAFSTIEVQLGVGVAGRPLREVSPADWRDVYAPRPPSIDSIAAAPGGLELRWSTSDTEAVTWNIYRDGARIASALRATAWLDETADPQRSSCYVAETCFESGTCSQHSPPSCWWGEAGERVTSLEATALANVGGMLADQYGRTHWSVWGDQGHQLTFAGFRPATSGGHLLQVEYGNGAGPVESGITCGVKRLRIVDEADGRVAGDGVVVMPHLGDWSRWALSSLVAANLDASRTYRIELFDDPTAINMSTFAHFALYSGGEGGAAVFNRVNVAALRVLQR